MGLKYNEDDYCDLYSKKICDNCGKCLEEEGIDIKAIKIEDIAKKVEENEELEEEFKESFQEEAGDIANDLLNSTEGLAEAYEKFAKESGLDLNSLEDEEEYVDAFEHIEYIEDYDLFDDATLEEKTVEIFPGVRKLKGTK